MLSTSLLAQVSLYPVSLSKLCVHFYSIIEKIISFLSSFLIIFHAMELFSVLEMLNSVVSIVVDIQL